MLAYLSARPVVQDKLHEILLALGDKTVTDYSAGKKNDCFFVYNVPKMTFEEERDFQLKLFKISEEHDVGYFQMFSGGHCLYVDLDTRFGHKFQLEEDFSILPRTDPNWAPAPTDKYRDDKNKTKIETV